MKFRLEGSLRSNKIKKNVLAMIAIKGISLLISLLYVPLLLHSLDSENYAIWLTLTSIVSWVVMFDIGLGNGLRNKLSIALANNDYKLGKSYVSTTYACILISVLIFIAVFIFVSDTFLSWNDILNAYNINSLELNRLVKVVFIAFGGQFVLSLLNSILFALQLPALSSCISMLGQLLSFFSVFVLVKVCDISSLLILGSVISLVPVIILLIASCFLFSNKKYKYISPSFHFIELSRIKEIMSLGVKFFILQIVTIVLYQTNNLIITHVVNSKSVVEYNIAYKYMNVLIMVYTIIVTPLWSATTEAYTKGDFQWISNVVHRLQKISFIMIIGGGFMVLFSGWIYSLWLGETSGTKINYSTTVLLYCYAVARILYSNYGYILNGIGKLNLQMVVTIVLAILYVPIVYYLGKIYGLNGILCVFVIVSVVNFVWSKIQYKKLITNTAFGIWNR